MLYQTYGHHCRIRVLNSRLQGFGNTPDLVDFEQQAVASLVLHCISNAFGVGDSEIISHDLDVRAVGEIGPGLPIILIKGVFNRHHWSSNKNGFTSWCQCSKKKLSNVISAIEQRANEYLDNPEWNFCKDHQAHLGWCIDWGHQETWSPSHTFRHDRIQMLPHPCQSQSHLCIQLYWWHSSAALGLYKHPETIYKL